MKMLSIHTKAQSHKEEELSSLPPAKQSEAARASALRAGR